jgi:hypothetical protein
MRSMLTNIILFKDRGDAYEVVQITIEAFLDWQLVQVVLGIPEACVIRAHRRRDGFGVSDPETVTSDMERTAR